jgi:hypothetical protein
LPASNDDVFVRVKYWEIIADNLKKRGWSLGYVSAIDSHGRTIWKLITDKAETSPAETPATVVPVNT